MKKLLFTIALVSVAALARTQSPGNVSSGLAIWLKADAGTSSAVEGDFLASWNDQSGNGRNATQSTAANKPRFRKAILNGNPAIETTGGARYFNIDLSSISNSNFTVFVVAQRTTTAAGQYILGVQQASPVGLHLGYAADNTARLGQSSSILNLTTTGYQGSTSEIPRTLVAEFSNTSGRTLSEYLNGAPTVGTLSGNTGYAISSNTGVIGRGYNTMGFAGYIGEIVVYNRVLTSTEKRQVLTYLSVKYGTTLADVDHLNFSGAGYDNDEVGIALNSTQGLSKVSNRSVNSDGMVELSSLDLTSGSYVVVGNNNGAQTFSSAGANGNCAINTLFNRSWKATVTGTVATVDLKFALTGLTYNASQVCLVVDPEANGFSDEAPIAGVISNDSIQFSSVRLADGALFTLAEGLTKYYAVSTGNANGAIWATTPTGTGATIDLTCGKFALEVNSGVTVTVNADVHCNGLNVKSGATFNLGNYLLHSIGDINVDGTFTATGSASVVQLDGKYAQQLRGTQSINVQGLTITNSRGVSINAPGLYASRVVQINTGTLTTNGKLYLVSNATTTGSIGPIGGDLVGNVTVNRNYVLAAHTAAGANASGGYVVLCAPIQNKTVNDWNDDFITSGFLGSQYPASSFNNVQYYVEAAPGGINTGFAGVATVNEVLAPGRGYFVYMNNGTYNIDVDGAIYKGNVNIPVTYTNYSQPLADGRNLVANPYPSAINWDAPGWTKTNINNAVYVYNPGNSQYATYIGGVSTLGGSPVIPSSQAFFVIASAASPVLAVSESVKTSTQGTFKTSKEHVLVRMTDGIFEDESVLVFDENETNMFNKDVDAMKMRTPIDGIPSLASIDELGVEYAINVMNTAENVEIPFVAFAPQGGLYKFSIEGLKGAWDLVDMRNGDVYPISNRQIVLDMTNGEEKEVRFVIRKHLTNEITTTNEHLVSTFVGDDLKILESGLAGEVCRVQVYNSVGALVLDNQVSVDASGNASIPCQVTFGTYVVRVSSKTGDWTKAGKVLKF